MRFWVFDPQSMAGECAYADILAPNTVTPALSVLRKVHRHEALVASMSRAY